MMDTIAQQLLERVSWGLKTRLYVGAGLSMMDLGTDIFMIYTYWISGQEKSALSLAIMVGLCILLQVAAVVANTKNDPSLGVKVREVLIVLSGVAPGIHAMRVGRGEEKKDHRVLDPEMELTITRGLELGVESIPGTRKERAGESLRGATNSICFTGQVASFSCTPS
jgi:hypothetical protein